MTTNVKELIEWLKTQDENKKVFVMKEKYVGYSYTTEFDDLVLPDKYGYSPNVDIFDNMIWFGER
jgi:hypothetical protein